MGDRLDVGVEDGRTGPLVLPPLPHDLRRGRDLDSWQALAEERGALRLVARIGVAVEQADRHRRHTRGAQPLGDGLDTRPVERDEHLSFVVEPLPHLEAPLARHERWLLAEAQVVDVGPVRAPDLQHVTAALRRHERCPGPLALRERVDDDRRPVHKGLHACRIEPGLGDSVHHPALKVGRGG